MSQNNPRWCQSNKKVKNKNLIRIFFLGGGARSVNQAILGQNFGTVYDDMHLKNLLGSIVRVGYRIPVRDFYLALNGLS